MYEHTDDVENAIVLINSTNHALAVIIEPWAEELEMATGASWRCVCYAPVRADIQIEFYTDCIIIYGLAGSFVRIFDDKSCVWQSFERLPFAGDTNGNRSHPGGQ